MKKTLTVFSLFAVIVLNCGCASYLRSRSSGDAKSGINIITSDDKPISVTVSGTSTPLKSALFFDGTQYQSPYKVYKYYLPKMYDNATLQVTKDGQTKDVKISRQKDAGWFWIEGVMPWMYESFTGKLFYYNDVYVDRLF